MHYFVEHIDENPTYPCGIQYMQLYNKYPGWEVRSSLKKYGKQTEKKGHYYHLKILDEIEVGYIL